MAVLAGGARRRRRPDPVLHHRHPAARRSARGDPRHAGAGRRASRSRHGCWTSSRPPLQLIGGALILAAALLLQVGGTTHRSTRRSPASRKRGAFRQRLAHRTVRHRRAPSRTAPPKVLPADRTIGYVRSGARQPPGPQPGRATMLPVRIRRSAGLLIITLSMLLALVVAAPVAAKNPAGQQRHRQDRRARVGTTTRTTSRTSAARSRSTSTASMRRDGDADVIFEAHPPTGNGVFADRRRSSSARTTTAAAAARPAGTRHGTYDLTDGARRVPGPSAAGLPRQADRARPWLAGRGHQAQGLLGRTVRARHAGRTRRQPAVEPAGEPAGESRRWTETSRETSPPGEGTAGGNPDPGMLLPDTAIGPGERFAGAPRRRAPPGRIGRARRGGSAPRALPPPLSSTPDGRASGPSHRRSQRAMNAAWTAERPLRPMRPAPPPTPRAARPRRTRPRREPGAAAPPASSRPARPG